MWKKLSPDSSNLVSCHIIYVFLILLFCSLFFSCYQSSLLSFSLMSYSSLPHLPRRESGVSLMYLTQMLTLWVFSVCLSADVCLSVALFASVFLLAFCTSEETFIHTTFKNTSLWKMHTQRFSLYVPSRPASTVWWVCTVRQGTMATCGFPGRSCSTSLTAIKQGHSTCSSASAAA